MIETPAQPQRAAELALIAGFIFLLILEAVLFPPDPPRRHQAGPPSQQAAAAEATSLPTPAP